jgi:hypothetical protein
MTLCIAAISLREVDPHIITVSDTMISGSIISADSTAIKIRPFHRDWMAMISADDVGQAIPIIAKAEEYFRGRKNTLAVARSTFKRAYQRHLVEMREDAVLSAYDMTIENFKKNGKRQFTETQFNRVCLQIEAVDPKCDFIVNGFDSQGRAHIFEVNGNGTDSVRDLPGFCCIGSGGWAAEMILCALNQNIDNTMNETIFNLCAAKFMAERALGVGKETFIHARNKKSFAFRFNDGMLEDIRDAWEKNGCPRVPDGIIDGIKKVWRPRCIVD